VIAIPTGALIAGIVVIIAGTIAFAYLRNYRR
jgi:hypothetical protein